MLRSTDEAQVVSTCECTRQLRSARKPLGLRRADITSVRTIDNPILILYGIRDPFPDCRCAANFVAKIDDVHGNHSLGIIPP